MGEERKKFRLIFHGKCNEFNMGEFFTKNEAKAAKTVLSYSWSGKFTIQKIS